MQPKAEGLQALLGSETDADIRSQTLSRHERRPNLRPRPLVSHESNPNIRPQPAIRPGSETGIRSQTSSRQEADASLRLETVVSRLTTLRRRSYLRLEPVSIRPPDNLFEDTESSNNGSPQIGRFE